MKRGQVILFVILGIVIIAVIAAALEQKKYLIPIIITILALALISIIYLATKKRTKK